MITDRVLNYLKRHKGEQIRPIHIAAKLGLQIGQVRTSIAILLERGHDVVSHRPRNMAVQWVRYDGVKKVKRNRKPVKEF